ncbi:RING domain-containing protein [Cryptosporidium ubiquitum]|uniref:RING domain-containing protein n=1 Tax=Cryptosporidium ubiquitum TaxID=857276 RepID=A0A1J4MNF1_9CRYT|nr:RING domain-containing protein [Cryptosporidium ubiquitum]OII74979.1 RING domain-containing protein [Cryptosporidium ubiquitum]
MSFYLQNESTGVDEEQGISWTVHLEPAEEIEGVVNQSNFRRLEDSGIRTNVIFTNAFTVEPCGEESANNSPEYQVITENRDTNNRIMLAIVVNLLIMISVFCLFTTILVQLLRDWGSKCDRQLKTWCIVWLSRFLLTSVIRSMSIIILKVYQSPSPFILVLIVNVLHIFGIAWWFYGIHLIYSNPPELTCRKNYSIALFLFWFQFVQIFVPILLPILLCVLILYILHRNGIRTEKKNVPEELLCKIQAIPFNEHIRNLSNSAHVTIFDENQTIIETQPYSGNLSESQLNIKEDGNSLSYTKEKSITISKSCPICVQEIEDDSTIRVLPCDSRHIFHLECIDGWFKQNCVCPICRSDVVQLLNETQAK